MVLSEKLTALNTAKQNLKTALINYGIDVTTTPFSGYYTLFKPLTYDYYVSPSGNDSNDGLTIDTPFLTINKAITTATNGKTIKILKGTYNESVSYIYKNLNIYGEDGTISTKQFPIGKNYSVNIDGITFKNVSDSGIRNMGYGDITNCTFDSCSANSNGGGISNESIGDIINCTFINNHTNSNGGAILNSGIGIIKDCTFKGNDANGSGGAIKTWGTCKISNCDFLETTDDNLYCDVATTICNTYWNTSSPSSSSYNSTLNSSTVYNDRTTPNHPERIT